MKKRRTYNIRLVRARRSYTISDIARLFGLHTGSVRSWQKKGLRPLEPGSYPLLFMGYEIKRFLSERQAKRRCKLADGEFYCPRCREARKSDPDKTQVIVTDRKMGQADVQVIVQGFCSTCNCKLTRFATTTSIKSTVWRDLITGA